ncbi:helix-turn-helix domain-containing protein [Streptomyces sp. NBC_01433]|uniref:helix-turn-helix domain-containing protein n=1 Tax=Streptomyces sp. NBC_01433 TaxID=2903864 RepID=UPI00225358E7|nr:helix-turn-helix domain-containing protein [Streptomyces sp. NBC_01433]MCX4675558.1 helix-turn-helix domain-containing protein [Streptomyces sp. NBC_01433]
MPQHSLPISLIAQALGVDEHALQALMAQRDNAQGDSTLVGLTVAEAARRLGVGRTKLYEYISSGEIASVKIGRLRRIPTEAVGEFLARRMRPGAGRPKAADFGTAA